MVTVSWCFLAMFTELSESRYECAVVGSSGEDNDVENETVVLDRICGFGHDEK